MSETLISAYMSLAGNIITAIEADMIKERQLEGIAIAKANGIIQR